MMIQHHTAPPKCATCGHLQRSTVQIGPIVDRNDFCSHPTGAKPMHTPCAWHRTPEQVRAIEAQEQATVTRFREVFGRRGL